jgi:hypothetical protein
MKVTFLWDWIDNRQIDKHLVSIAVLYGTWRLTEWAMIFATSHPDVNGAAVIAAVTAPYAALQGASIKFYFEARNV